MPFRMHMPKETDVEEIKLLGTGFFKFYFVRVKIVFSQQKVVKFIRIIYLFQDKQHVTGISPIKTTPYFSRKGRVTIPAPLDSQYTIYRDRSDMSGKGQGHVIDLENRP